MGDQGRDEETKAPDETDARVEPAGESDLLGEAYHDSFLAIRSREEAREHPDGTLVLEGEYGGVIYLSCPVRHLRCDELRLRRLLADIDSCFADDIRGARVVFRCLAPGSVVAGGGGGGLVVDGLWLNRCVREIGLEPRIRRALLGEE